MGSVTIYSNSMELKSMQQHSQNNSTVLVFQKYPPEVINSAVTPYNHLSHQTPPTSSLSSPSSSHRTEKSGFTDENSEDMKVAKIKHQLVREFLAETLGTYILVLFGNGAIAQFKGQVGSPFIHVAFGYGLALTLAMATLKKCKWIQVPVYWAAQYLGAFLASAILYGNYADFIKKENHQ